MLTPVFELTQCDKYLMITIRVPYAKVSDADVFFDDYCFKFYCKPYFLRLNLPGKVVFCEVPKVTYDDSTSTFTISMPKATKGEVFEDLDFLTKLFASKAEKVSYKGVGFKSPLIEVIGETSSNYEEEEEFNWEIEQPIMEEEIRFNKEAKFGFANNNQYPVFRLKEECSILFDDIDLSEMSPSERAVQRKDKENKDFSAEHYIAELLEKEDITLLLKFQPDWVEISQTCSSNRDICDTLVHFTDEEKERLRNLPNKEYIIDKEMSKALYLGLVDILFGYAYDKRVTEGETTVESAWNISKLSATLSWCETFPSLNSVLQSCVRRSLVYPLFRNWELAMAVVEDTRTILSLGRKYVLKCFLDIHKTFCKTEPWYIMNDLYITDYCVWIQGGCKSETLKTLADAMSEMNLNKEDLQLDLEGVEGIAELATKMFETEEKIGSVAESLSSLGVN